MATVTPQYSWPVPTSTDYVKDGATAIESLGDAVDATLYTALGGAYPGLRLVKKQTIGSAVSSVTVTNAFSATYENYLIQIGGGSASVSTSLAMRLGATSSNYYSQFIYTTWNNSLLVDATTTATSWVYGGSGGTNGLQMNLQVLSPFLSKATRATTSGVGASTTFAGHFSGFLDNTTSYTDLTILPNSGTLTGGTIYVYGFGAS